MKKLTAMMVSLLFAASIGFTQEYEDLKGLYVDGKYDKVVVKAEHYTKKDKTMNDPLPYLYLSKALFKISMDDRFKDEDQFRSAEFDALNYFITYTKKDKGKIYADISEPHLNEMKNRFYEESENFFLIKKYSKAISSLKKLLKVEPENIPMNLVKGLNEYLNKNKSEGKKNVNLALTKLKELTSIESWSDEDKRFLKYGLIQYTQYLLDNKDFSGAKSAISMGYQYFQGEDDQDYKDMYNKVVNG